MGEIVNLRRARKQKARAEGQAAADANRLAFGRSKVERRLAKSKRALAEANLEAHRLVRGDADD